jgi:hypothetical protein
MSDDDSFYERIINELDSEVMRLKTENTDFKKLITELCDALTRVRPHLAQPDLELEQRAREATR